MFSLILGSLRFHPHVSLCFLINNFCFTDKASVHTNPANSTANPNIFFNPLSRVENDKSNPNIFESGDVSKSFPVSYQQ